MHCKQLSTDSDGETFPCGMCDPCRRSLAEAKTAQQLLEFTHCKQAVFTTLTYSNENMPRTDKPGPPIAVFSDHAIEKLQVTGTIYHYFPRVEPWETQTDRFKKDYLRVIEKNIGKRLSRRLRDKYPLMAPNKRYEILGKRITEKMATIPEPKYIVHNTAGAPTVSVKDVQDFQKRLRYECDKDGVKLAFFSIGEYGSKTQRPHAHANIFLRECPFEFEEGTGQDSVDWQNPNTLTGYMYKKCSKAWKKGGVRIYPFNMQRAFYVCKYVVKRDMGRSPPRDIIEDKIARADGSKEDFFLLSRGQRNKGEGLGYPIIPELAERAKGWKDIYASCSKEQIKIIGQFMTEENIKAHSKDELHQFYRDNPGITPAKVEGVRNFYWLMKERLEISLDEKTYRYQLPKKWRDAFAAELGVSDDVRKLFTEMLRRIKVAELNQLSPKEREKRELKNEVDSKNWKEKFWRNDNQSQTEVT